MYLPSEASYYDVAIKHRSIPGVDYLRYNDKKLRKNTLSIYKMSPNQKLIKKVKEIRHFVFKTSIFNKFKPDTEANLDRAF